MKKKNNPVYICMLLTVVFVWGFDPLVNRYLYKYFSAAALAALSTFVSAIMFLAVAGKGLKNLNRRYFKVTVPIALVNSLACVLQRIGLQYTSPARYAFLEHLSCVTVPLILLVFFRKRPNVPQALAAVSCLAGCALLAGADILKGSIGIGDLLCAAAGLLLGFGIVATAHFTDGMDIKLFMSVHSVTYFLTSVSLMLALHFIPVGGAPMERIVFSFSPLPILAAALFGILTAGICWMLRNEATRHLSPSLVAVIAPFAAVITAVLSILEGFEEPTPAFLSACALILAAAILAGLGERQGEPPAPAAESASEATAILPKE